MLREELMEILRNGENSGVEFKRDDVHSNSLAKEIAALLNFEGGKLFLGVEDDGIITGLTKDTMIVEEWIMNLCRNNIQPAIIPYWETFNWNEKTIGMISLPPDSPDKPYKAKKGGGWVTFIRVGSTSREATREEEARLYQSAGLLRYDSKPVMGSTIHDLDERRLKNYFQNILSIESMDEIHEWRKILQNTGILLYFQERYIPSIAGLLLFGKNPKSYLPQSGISATSYPGTEKEYDVNDEEFIRGPLLSLFAEDGTMIEPGIIDRSVDFVHRNMGTVSFLLNGRRREKKDYPKESIREAIVNAVTHRDYSINVMDIEISMYSHCIEIISPGRLPNTVTVEKMKMGYRATRNEMIKEILRDYGYVESRGMGVRYGIIKKMIEHNGTEPDLIEEETRFIVRLSKSTSQ